MLKDSIDVTKLEGMDENIKLIDENDSTLSDITKFLTPFGFVLIDTFDENIGAGVALYIKN